MAETTVLRSTASPQNGSPIASSATPHAKTSGPHPVVNVTMGSGGRPQVGGTQASSPHRQVQILEKSAMGMRNGGFPPPLTPAVAARVAELGIMPAAPGAASGSRPTARPQPVPRATSLSPDMLLFCRLLVDRYIRELPPGGENEAIAAVTLAAIDETLATVAATSTPDAPPLVQVFVEPPAAPQAAQAAPPPATVVVGARNPTLPVGGPRRVERVRPPIDVDSNTPPDGAAE